MTPTTRHTSALLIVAAALATGACGGSAPAAEVDPAVYERGQTLYGEFCSSCHATDGSGGVGPRLADGAATDRVGDLDGLRTVISEGGDRMPGLSSRLTPEQIDDIARYVDDRL